MPQFVKLTKVRGNTIEQTRGVLKALERKKVLPDLDKMIKPCTFISLIVGKLQTNFFILVLKWPIFLVYLSLII